MLITWIPVIVLLVFVIAHYTRPYRMKRLRRKSKTYRAWCCGAVTKSEYSPSTSMSVSSDGKAYYTVGEGKMIPVIKGLRFATPGVYDSQEQKVFKYPSWVHHPMPDLFKAGTLYYNTDSRGVDYYVGFISDDGTFNSFSSQS